MGRGGEQSQHRLGVGLEQPKGVHPPAVDPHLPHQLHITGCVTIQIVQEFQMGGYDDEALMEMNLAKLGEKDPSVGRAPTSLLSNATRQQSGSVKQIKFFDADVAYYQQAGAHYSVLGSTVPVPDSPSIQALSTYRSAPPPPHKHTVSRVDPHGAW
jgi:hypothetical protein